MFREQRFAIIIKKRKQRSQVKGDQALVGGGGEGRKRSVLVS
jgi:hypothetical protein